MATSKERVLSTADERRKTVLRTAIHAFAAKGYYGTTTTEVAKEAGISQAYLYRLFPDKEALFVAVIEHCSQVMARCMSDGAAAARSTDPEEVLAAMGDAYARLIVDRDLLMVLRQAECAASVPAIGDAVRAHLAKQVEYARAVSGASPEQVQRFFATGQLCNLYTAIGAEQVDAPWARTLGLNLRHY
ncbi:TetR/AcrR family transcriptional regulator [Actinokineospora bangkokensis]|uniref:TetR family transcriptional regulator n=1 Tax=Actinokineospora bangkokensis TaxID=1193682 RepID=A0A1Q9LLA4_9PSEU|nr:TetR/AcrR family transcriptional regulator [Actinokineospora bangkokensis]OLR92789.1 TetR family transcriptional regulator [Actinokineospora bangkokensis]